MLRVRPDAEHTADFEVLLGELQAGVRIEGAVHLAQPLVRRMVDVDDDDVETPTRTLGQPGIYVSLSNHESRIGHQLGRQRHEPVLDPGDHRRQELDDLDGGHLLGGECGMGRVSETEPTDENIQIRAAVHLDRRVSERPLGRGVVAAHQELVIERDLGDHGSGFRQEFAAPQRDHPDRSFLGSEELDVRRGHDRRSSSIRTCGWEAPAPAGPRIGPEARAASLSSDAMPNRS